MFDFRVSEFGHFDEDEKRNRLGVLTRAIVKDIVTTNDEFVDSEKVVLARFPATAVDAVKALLPHNLQFGWLTPKYTENKVTSKNVYNRTVHHYHVHPVNRDENRLHWILPSYADLNRLGIYGANGEQIHNCIRAAIDVMRCHNVPIKQLVMHPKDYDQLSIWIGKNYCFVDVTIDKFLDVSIVVSPQAMISFLEAE